jgi:hypothetical protein
MKTYTTLTNLGGTLTNNSSTANLTLLGQLINDNHRYLLQKYFDNERTVSLSTLGGQSLTTTGALAIGAKSATLTAAWTYPSCQQYVNFSSGEQRFVTFTLGSAAISWTVALTDTATTAISALGLQDYPIPADVSKIKNDTINVGQLKFQPTFVQSRQEWDRINFLPYTSDIPNYCYIYNGKMSIFPIPSTTGNVITFNYKGRVADLTFTDYSTGTLALNGMTAGSTTVTGLLTTWNTVGLYPINVDVTHYNLYIKANPPYGDGIWYPIQRFNSDTSLTLALPVVAAPNITATTTYVIGQMPLLSEDFHDMMVYGALKTYFSSIVTNPEKFKEYSALYNERLELLKDYAGTKSVNVDLEAEPNIINPNLFIYGN